MFCSFLALVLRKALEDRLAALGRNGSWPAIIADIDALTETELDQDGKRFMLRSTPGLAAGLALRAAGVALPPTVQDRRTDSAPKCSATLPSRRQLSPLNYLRSALSKMGLTNSSPLTAFCCSGLTVP